MVTNPVKEYFRTRADIALVGLLISALGVELTEAYTFLSFVFFAGVVIQGLSWLMFTAFAHIAKSEMTVTKTKKGGK